MCIVDECNLCCFFCPHSRSSAASAVFDLNASLNDFAPVSPIKFTVDWMTMGKK